MASSNYGKEVSLPAANGMAGSGGKTQGTDRNAKSLIGQTAVPPMGKARPYSNIAVNAMGKNGTMQNDTVPKVKKLRKN